MLTRIRGNDMTGWSKTDQLTPGSDNTVSLQIQFRKAGYYTVQFAVDYPPDAFSEIGTILVLADIIWTVAGNPITRTITVVNGTTISGMGESVSVNIRDYSGAGLNPYTVHCSIAPGTRPTSGNPPYYGGNTETLVAIPDRRGIAAEVGISAGSFREFDIPINIGVNSLYLRVSPAAFVAGVSEALEDFVYADIYDGGHIDYRSFNTWIPLQPTAVGIIVSSDLGGPDIYCTPIYGIEG